MKDRIDLHCIVDVCTGERFIAEAGYNELRTGDIVFTTDSDHAFRVAETADWIDSRVVSVIDSVTPVKIIAEGYSHSYSMPEEVADEDEATEASDKEEK